MSMNILKDLKRFVGLSPSSSIHDIGCRAIKNNGDICGADPMGQSNSGRIQYCSSHAPSGAVPYGRMGSIEYYIPEEDRIIEKD